MSAIPNFTQLPKTIQEKLTKNLSNETIFNSYKSEYERALERGGFTTNLKYKNINKNPMEETEHVKPSDSILYIAKM